VTIAVSPAAASVAIGQSLSFTAQVSGATDTGVSWSIQETNGGAVTSDGLYTAPSTAGVYHVIATSQSDPLQTVVVEVQVRAATGAITVN
jgi:chitinase